MTDEQIQQIHERIAKAFDPLLPEREQRANMVRLAEKDVLDLCDALQQARAENQRLRAGFEKAWEIISSDYVKDACFMMANHGTPYAGPKFTEKDYKEAMGE